MKEFDVVVVGAGPAGLMAARMAARAGVSVVVLEASRKLGEKVCGEAISRATLDTAEVQPSPKFVALSNVDHVVVYAPDESRYIEISAGALGFEGGYILEKRLFLLEMARLAVKEGAEIWVNTAARNFQRVEGGLIAVKTSAPHPRSELLAKVVIGCDGVGSVVARKFFVEHRLDLVSCIQYKMVGCQGLDERTLEFFVGSSVAPHGYVWIFPKGGDVANVGIGVKGANAKKHLDAFIQNHPKRFSSAKVVEVGAATVPVGGQLPKIVDDGVMLCGDAAGQVIPLTGGGIHSSIAAGKIAGRVAAEAVKAGDTSADFLAEYPSEYDKYWGQRIRRSLRAQKLISKLSDSELNELATILSGEDIIDLANGLNIARVGAKLLRHPLFAAKLARSLLSE